MREFKDLKIAVAGTGYVGLSIATLLSQHHEYKIVHCHAYTIGYFCLKAAKKAGIPVRIAHSHNNETVHDIKYATHMEK